MRETGIAGKLKKSRFLVIAFGCATTLHLGVLVFKLDSPLESTKKKREISLRLLADQIIELEEHEQNPPSQKASNQNEASEAKTTDISQMVTVDPNKQPPSNIFLPSVYSESFQKQLEDDAREYGRKNPNKLESFSRSFESIPEEVLPQIKYQQGPLGGGNYKIRKGSIECKQLVMVPQSFDDFTQGTVYTTGECEDKKTFKLELNRMNKSYKQAQTIKRK